MLQNTKGIVLRAIKYGDTSLVCNIFTEVYGVQAYMVQGVRSSKTKNNRSGLLQPASLLDMVVYRQPQKNLQRIKEFHLSYFYTSLHEEVIKNSIALFSVELLLRLLPENASAPELFAFASDYLVALDKAPAHAVGNFPLYFIIGCCRHLGYDIIGTYSEETPHLNIAEGGFTAQLPSIPPFVNDADASALSNILKVSGYDQLTSVEMNAAMRFRLLDWFMAFLHRHSQHMGNVKSLAVLQAILH